MSKEDYLPGFFRIGSYTLGFEHSTVGIQGRPYLERWFVMLFGCTIRLHKFYRGDDDRALHDHPWRFWTFPLRGYWERTPAGTQYVKPWRLHYRPSGYQHTVVDFRGGVPAFTLVVTSRKERRWGFWPGGKFVYYKDFHGSPR